MIGMPRSRLMIAELIQARTGTPDTRMAAQTRPSTVDSSSEPMVTWMVSHAPWRRMGRNCQDWVRNSDMIDYSGQVQGTRAARCARQRAGHCGACLQTPLLEDGVDAAVSLEFGQCGVDLAHQLGVALAAGDADVVGHGCLIGGHQV